MQEITHKIVILAYQNSPYLDECIASLNPEKYSADMICCTSTPSVFIEDICRKYGVTLIVNPSTPGIASDWNFGLAQAKGGWVTLAHQDDIYHANYISAVRRGILQHTEATLIVTWYREVMNGAVRKNLNFFVKYILIQFAFLFRKEIRSIRNKRRLLMLGNPIPCGGVTINNMDGDLSFDPSFKYALDWKFWLDLTSKDKSFVFINKPLIDIRVHEESTTVTLMKGGSLRQQEELKLFSMFWPRWFAKTIAYCYKLSHMTNRI